MKEMFYGPNLIYKNWEKQLSIWAKTGKVLPQNYL